MKSKILLYSGAKATITYDVPRCIHAAECVHGLSEVFDPNRKPWIDPDRAEPEQLLPVVASCPTGALHLEAKDDSPAESVPEQNAVTIDPNGPLYFRGEGEVLTNQDVVLLADTRIALCRCGGSQNKPLCDGQHTHVKFEDAGALGETTEAPHSNRGGKIRLTALPNGPLLFEGRLSVRGADGRQVNVEKGAFCRCGASDNKPFCDGAHSRVGFTSE